MWPPHDVPPQGGHATSAIAPSSQVMMTTPLPCVYHVDASTAGRLFANHVSPWATRLLRGAQRLCISSQVLGVIQTKSGAFTPSSVFTIEVAPGYGRTLALHSVVLLMICLK